MKLNKIRVIYKNGNIDVIKRIINGEKRINDDDSHGMIKIKGKGEYWGEKSVESSLKPGR